MSQTSCTNDSKRQAYCPLEVGGDREQAPEWMDGRGHGEGGGRWQSTCGVAQRWLCEGRGAQGEGRGGLTEALGAETGGGRRDELKGVGAEGRERWEGRARCRRPQLPGSRDEAPATGLRRLQPV